MRLHRRLQRSLSPDCRREYSVLANTALWWWRWPFRIFQLPLFPQ